ncbi:MAG: zinc-dependent alcohol dehydrogenase family protein [Chitinophagales bacterium]
MEYITHLPATMQAMILESPGQTLIRKTVPIPSPSPQEVQVKVIACGICRTDLHIIDGELDHPKLPLILGHEIIGRVERIGHEVSNLKHGDIVGIPWLGYTCGKCKYCLSHHENLCDEALFTGYTRDGGFAEYTLAHQEYCFPISSLYANAGGAPLLCAGLIGYRAYSMVGNNAANIGIYGFGAAAHILIQVAKHQGRNIFAFTRKGDNDAQHFAIKLGATWAGDSSQAPPCILDAAIIFAPDGGLIPKALHDIDKAGTVVCGGIHMSDIPSFPYKLLWEERNIRSVANLTRSDGENYLKLAAEIPIQTQVQLYKLDHANEAINDLRAGKIQGAAVLVME